MTHVLVVDDDRAMRDMVATYLRSQDFEVTAAANGPEMERALHAGTIDLVVLDLKLGREDGIDLLRALRPKLDMPFIIISGHRRDEIDRVIGLEIGADDFLTKPFGLRELLARVRAVLRRYEQREQAPATSRAPRYRYHFAGWSLSSWDRRLVDPGNGEVPLTASEYALLVAFVQAPQQILTREQLLNASRLHEDIFDRSIDVQVLRLRRKIEVDPRNPGLIQTRRNAGYIFDTPVERIKV
ncbi:DNA-binding response regulator, OmpR family, contains REC and winged-helix (wHTH) domain [Arboricoccus pini]|uniref:Regulatory protein VirG n=1 Tax=Arboricoccus pini TaxID=1963835 RepID=A0A212RQ92_9PROT|nr:response regulator [Arboricoccus pini]SNB74701.1 DNA-binding response regulator, OmpR family, contains REC and winged-helix (wHTH) domain [Arboricoccus pini]